MADGNSKMMSDEALDRVEAFLDSRDATAPQAGPGLAVTFTTDGGYIKLSALDVRELVIEARSRRARVEGCSDCAKGECKR